MIYIIRLLMIVALGGLLAAAQTQPSDQTSNSQPPKPQADAAAHEDHDPLLDPPPLPHGKVSLLGGTITKLDMVRDRMTVKAFAGHNVPLTFDTRTKFFLNEVPVSQREVKPGQRIYVDTMLNGDKVFAKSIWIQTEAATGNGRGQVLGFDSGENVLTVRDEVSSQPMKFRVTPETVLRSGKDTRPVTAIKPGSLVTLTFGPQQGKYGTVKEISLTAEPGQEFSFFGTITFIDLSRRMIAIANRNDQKTYDISLGPVPSGVVRTLHEGSQVGVSAVFDGKQYVARELAPAAAGESAKE